MLNDRGEWLPSDTGIRRALDGSFRRFWRNVFVCVCALLGTCAVGAWFFVWGMS